MLKFRHDVQKSHYVVGRLIKRSWAQIARANRKRDRRRARSA